MRCRLIILLFVLQVSAVGLWAQPQQYRFSRVDITQGLSHNEVNAILKDEKGFMWFGTMSGLDRYDGYGFKIFKHDLRDSTTINEDNIAQLLEGPDNKLWVRTHNGFNLYNRLTEKFDHNIPQYLNSIHIPETTVSDIKKDREGNYWFVITGSGLYKYMPSLKKAIHFTNQSTGVSLYSNNVTGISINAKGDVWIIYSNGVLEKLDGRSNTIIYRSEELKSKETNEVHIYTLFADAQDDLWMYAANNEALGVFYCNTATHTLRHISKNGGDVRLNTDIVNGITQDSKGVIWIATDHGGINLVDKKNFSIRYLLSREDDNNSLSQNSINCLYKDNTGITWIGTYKKGLSYYRENLVTFPLYRHQASDKNSLSYDDVNRFAEDAAGNLWIGTNGGGLIYFNRRENSFTRYVHDANNANSLSNDVIVSMYIDHEQKLWLGTYYGGLDCFDGKTFTHYRHNEADSSSLADDRVWELLEDSQHRLWVGTLSGGLDLLNRSTQKFTHYKPNGTPNSVHSIYITALVEDSKGNIWIATAYGIDMLEKKSGTFLHYIHDDAHPFTSLSNNNAITILEDSRGLIWVGTTEGLDIFDTQKQTFKTLRTEDGLPDNTILNLLEDGAHNLWISTPNGIGNIIVSSNKASGGLSFVFKNYNEADGLQGREFNENASLKTRAGELIFGGANGFNIFQPQQIKSGTQKAILTLTDFQVFNKTIPIGETSNGHIILPQSIAETKEITLKYNENVFSIQFAALDFLDKSKFKYVYRLEGFSKNWLTADAKTRTATFTNLDPGTYTFKVKLANNNGTWNEEGISLVIHILPPFWKTGWAYLTYFLLVAGTLIFARHMIVQRAGMRFAIAQERKEAQRLHDLDMMKIRFLTNVSHEFRTPLSLILTPLDKIIRNTSEPSQKSQLHLIHRNARRLLNLVNQLLDFRKMEVQEIKLNPTPGDIIKFIRDISYSFTDLAENKHIGFLYQSATEHLYTGFDHDKIERILFNLLSNAFKFTPEKGEVAIELTTEKKEDVSWLTIKVKDTGIGIPAEKKHKIFERFFQHEIPGHMVNQGSGIGLAITKEFVKLHEGFVQVESQVNKGSCFTVTLPFLELPGAATIPLEDLIEEEEDAVLFNETETETALAEKPTPGYQLVTKNKKPVVLLVEDNEDFRFYLKDNLREYFTIEEAANGKEGWQKTLSAHPDLVVSDISMPVMNGIDLCKKIKNDIRTRQIPVILLTALAGEENHLQGLETGASDYLTKPFNFEIMLSRIRNLLAQQVSLKKVFTKQVEAKPTDVSVESPDEKFVQQALAIVEKNLSNTEFSVEELSRELYMSRVAVYKKIFALTGKTPIEFIRSIRLNRAAQLLEKSQLTVAEVAYEVGFNNPKYFSKYFKSAFNTLPSTYQAEKHKEEEKGNT